jgi:hypothetical protein
MALIILAVVMLLLGACTEQVKVSEVVSASGSSDSSNSAYVAGVAFRYIFYNKDYTEAINEDVTVNIRVVDIEGDLVNDHTGEIYLSFSGSATGSKQVNIANGVGSANIRDSVEESVLLTITELDDQGLRVPEGEYIKFSSTGAVTGSATRFVVSGNASEAADGTAKSFTIEAVDDDGLIVNDYSFDVKAAAAGAATADEVIDVVAGSGTLQLSSSDAGSVTITLSDIRDTGLDCSDNHQFEFVAGTVSKLTIISATSAYVGIQETVTVKSYDANDNFVSSYNGSATLTFSGGDVGDGATLNFSSGIASTDIKHNSVATLTIGTSSSLTDDSESMQFVAGGAYQFVIDQTATSATVGTSTTITVRVRDYTDAVTATDYQGDVTLATTGSTTGAGLVNIINGTGTIDIGNSVAESVTLSLSDTESSSLDSSSTLSFTFNAGVAASYQLESIANTTTGTSSTVTLSCLDSFGNPASSGCGASATFTEDDGDNTAVFDSGATANIDYNTNSTYTTTITDTEVETVTVSTTSGGSQTVSFLLGDVAKYAIVDGPGESDEYLGAEGFATTVTIQAQDLGGNLVATEDRDVTLNLTGSATATGIVGNNVVVDIIDGVGTVDVSDAVAEDVTLSLLDEAASTGLDCTSTGTISFKAARVVAPRFSNAPDWNDYMETNGLAACDGSGNDRCTHGGHYKMIELDAASGSDLNCEDIQSVEDILDVFKWECEEDATKDRIVSTGFKPNKGLGDLIDGSTPSNPVWRQNYIKIVRTLNDGTLYSKPQAWWSNNTLVSLPDSSGGLVTLSTQGVIYVQSSSAISRGYNINADKVGVVTLPGAKLLYDGTDGATITSGAESGGSDTAALISVGSQKYFWIEGELDGNDDNSITSGLIFGAGSNLYGTINRSDIYQSDAAGVDIQGNYLTMSDLSIKHNGGNGVTLTNNQSTMLERVQLYYNSGDGIEATSVTSTLIYQPTIIDNGVDGINITTTAGTQNNNMILEAVVAYNGGSGIDADNTAIFNSSIVQNSGTEIVNSTAEYITNTLVNSYSDSTNNYYNSNSLDDSGLSTTSDEFSNNTDSVNPDQSSGQAPYSVDLSTRFAYNYHFWATNATTACASGDICQMRSFKLDSGDLSALNQTDTYSTGATCVVTGDISTTHNWQSGSVTFLINTSEVINLADNSGDDDGFCEPGELCRESPNYGAYQGHGTISKPSGCGATDAGVQVYGNQ